jgi:hypothetical protein
MVVIVRTRAGPEEGTRVRRVAKSFGPMVGMMAKGGSVAVEISALAVAQMQPSGTEVLKIWVLVRAQYG